MSKLVQLLREETAGLHGRLLLARLMTALLPVYVGSRVRALALRLAGFRIGRGTLFFGIPIISGPKGLYQRLTVGCHCWFNIGCVLDLGAAITIGDRVAVGHEVMLLTTSHHVGNRARRAAQVFAEPIVIGDGAWLGARCVVLPGITVGSGAVVAAGAIVTKDVPPNTLVAGVPARVLRELSADASEAASSDTAQGPQGSAGPWVVAPDTESPQPLKTSIEPSTALSSGQAVPSAAQPAPRPSTCPAQQGSQSPTQVAGAQGKEQVG